MYLTNASKCRNRDDKNCIKFYDRILIKRKARIKR